MKKSILCLLILLSVLVNAQSSDIFLKIPAKQFCPCEQVTFRLNIQNNQPFSNTYTINSNIFNDNFIFSENPVSLSPKEEKEILIFVNLPCETYGKINGYLEVKSINSQYNFPYTIDIIPCYNYSLRLADFYKNNTYKYHDGSYNFCSEDIKKIPILINNEVNISNIYHFDVEGPNFAKLEYNNIVLAGRQKGIAIIDLETESLGSYLFDFSVISDLGKIKKNITVEATIERCYGLDIIFNDSLELCGCESKTVKGFIKNNGKTTEIVNVGFEGPEWVTLDQDELLIAGENKKEFELSINPGENCTFGKYDVRLNAKLSKNPDVKAEKAINIKLVSQEDCGKIKVFNFKKFLLYLSAIITVLIILLIIFLIIKAFKSKPKTVEEKIEEKPKEKKREISKKEISGVDKDKLYQQPKKEKIKKVSKKAEKKVKKINRYLILSIIWIIVVLAAVVAVIYYFKLWDYIKDFIILYWVYIVVGLVLLFIIILFLRFYKPKD